MANRLPTPGSDNNNWGQILNDYLLASHGADGTLNASAVVTAIPAGSLTKAQLSSTVQSSLNNADAAAAGGSVADGAVTTIKLATGAVTAAKITDGTITAAKLDSATQTTLTSVAAKYTKPGSGIPATDLDTASQTNLTKASTALQSADIAGKADDTTVVHKTGAETIAGVKNFTAAPTINGSAIIIAGDSRLSDQRTPLDASVTNAKLDTATQSAVTKANSAVQTVNGISPTSGNVVVAGSTLVPTSVKTSAYTAAAGDLVLVDTTSAAVTITLPIAIPGSKAIGVKLVTLGTGNSVTVATSGSDVFNKTGGNTTGTLTLLNQGFVVVPSTGLWVAQSTDLSLTQLDSRYAASSGSVSSLIYNGTTYGTRPVNATSVMYIGPIAPTIGGAGNAVNGTDVWLDTSS